jgi:Uma2 family endonuclease
MPPPSTAHPQATTGPAWELATLFPEQGDWSEAEYLSLTKSTNRFVEMSAGCIEFPSMPSIPNQYILFYIHDLLRVFVLPRRLGLVLAAVFRLRLTDRTFREPDIAFLSASKSHLANEQIWESADLVVEIVSKSPEDRKRDYIDKRADYAAAGIAEYWIIDPQDQTITVYSLASDHTYPDTTPYHPGQHAPSKLLPGFQLDVSATFAAANPNPI